MHVSVMFLLERHTKHDFLKDVENRVICRFFQYVQNLSGHVCGFQAAV